MQNKRSLQEVTDYKLNDTYYRPHPTYNIKYLLNSIQANLGIEKTKTLPRDCFKKKQDIQHTILILLDGLGFNLLEESLPFLPKDIQDFFETELLISKITTIYPSSTTSVIPFIMTGYLPEESGLYEWWQYEHNSGKVIIPFRHVYRGDGKSEELTEEIVDSRKIFKTSRFYKELKDNNIIPYAYKNPDFIAPFNKISFEPAEIVDEFNFTDNCKNAIEKIKKNKDSKTFQYIYDPFIDATEHYEGRKSEKATQMVHNKLSEIYQLIQNLKDKKLNNVQVIITADHGLTQYSLKNEVILDEAIPDIQKYLKINENYETITHSGSPRSCVLHIKNELIDEFIKEVTPHLKGFAEIFKTEDLKDLGILNNDIEYSEAFRKNFGNVVIMAYNHKGVWFKEDNRMNFKGQHGGLSQDELQIPLIVY